MWYSDLRFSILLTLFLCFVAAPAFPAEKGTYDISDWRGVDAIKLEKDRVLERLMREVIDPMSNEIHAVTGEVMAEELKKWRRYSFYKQKMGEPDPAFFKGGILSLYDKVDAQLLTLKDKAKAKSEEYAKAKSTTEDIDCPKCGGDGYIMGKTMSCPRCRGSGKVKGDDSANKANEKRYRELEKSFEKAHQNLLLLKRSTARAMLTGQDISENQVNIEIGHVVHDVSEYIDEKEIRWVDEEARLAAAEEAAAAKEEEANKEIVPTQSQLGNLRARILKAKAAVMRNTAKMQAESNPSKQLLLRAKVAEAQGDLLELQGKWQKYGKYDESGLGDPFAEQEVVVEEKPDLPFDVIENPTPRQIQKLKSSYEKQKAKVEQYESLLGQARNAAEKTMIESALAKERKAFEEIQMKWDYYKKYDE